VVVVLRPTDYQELVARHGTRDQAAFFLASRGRSLDDVESRHQRQEAALAAVSRRHPAALAAGADPAGRPQPLRVRPEDIVVAVGQDGLVANVAKYLAGQPVIGVNPDPAATMACWCHMRPPRWPTCCGRPRRGKCASSSGSWPTPGWTMGSNCWR
jgi:hypothetical protein